ncbi:hypothetical protein LXD69_00230 [Flavobacterium sediminilitoris]|uniref:SGNH hydrolase-type esterase domain-containing protein n=1 Tax=Flavobacterium sediminilitoris TaxID=2024526 RepID=A0ABY4HM76_9FLAO|nr:MULTISPECIES: hypothetical protein [Flavobacterium]UOX33958.1 hypothetical protein LXD69_00230 [Flavobacterium sediminilitoris]
MLPKKLFPENKTITKNVVVDSLLLDAISEANDTIANTKIKENKKIQQKKKVILKKKNGVAFPTEKYNDFKGNQYLISFYEKLFQLESEKKGNVRIAYYGDSMTDGDMIVKDFRTYLQEKFGGNGVGFVSITSESASSRSSLVHEFSSNWKYQSYLKGKKPSYPFGVNGHVFYANDTLNAPWVRYKANKTRFAMELNKPTLFYGQSENKDGEVFYISNGDTITKKLLPSKRLNTMKLSEGNISSLKVFFKDADSIPIYGFNFDDGKGIHVDNFSSRGNSGLPLSIFSKNMMNQFQEQLGYDLIILHYGTNVLNYGSLNYSWYERKMERVVAHLKECFPDVTILVVSTADKSTKYGLEMKTDSAVVPLSTAQKRYAIASESGFVNLYTLMGGDGSMVKWVEGEPAKANKDYTHFNFRGANEVAKLLYKQINEGYTTYKTLRLKGKVMPKVKIKKDSIHKIKDSLNAQ